MTDTEALINILKESMTADTFEESVRAAAKWREVAGERQEQLQRVQDAVGVDAGPDCSVEDAVVRVETMCHQVDLLMGHLEENTYRRVMALVEDHKLLKRQTETDAGVNLDELSDLLDSLANKVDKHGEVIARWTTINPVSKDDLRNYVTSAYFNAEAVKLDQLMSKRVSTVADDLIARLDSELCRIEPNLEARLGGIEAGYSVLDGKIGRARSEMDENVDKLQARWEERMDSLANAVNTSLHALHDRVDRVERRVRRAIVRRSRTLVDRLRSAADAFK